MIWGKPISRWLRAWRRRASRAPYQERDRLELYEIACRSVGAEPALPVNKDPQLARLRYLKDRIRDGHLRPVRDGEEPDVWTQIDRDELRRFAERHNHAGLLALTEKWAGGKKVEPRPETAAENPRVSFTVYHHDNRRWETHIHYHAVPQSPDSTFVKFSFNGGVLDAMNIDGVTDNGVGDFTFTFDRPLNPERLVVRPMGTTPNTFRVVATSDQSVRIVSDGKEPETIALRFDD